VAGAAERLANGVPTENTLAKARQAFCGAGYASVGYLEFRAHDHLSRLEAAAKPARLLMAA
jgi:hypothetical protein